MITELSALFLAVEDITPKAPPGSNGLLLLASYGKWFAFLAALCGIVYGGGKFAVEKYNGGSIESPKIIAGCLIGGAVAAASGALLNAVVVAAQS